jgi:hypothetical protein
MPQNVVIGFCYISSLFLSDFVKDFLMILKVKQFPCSKKKWSIFGLKHETFNAEISYEIHYTVAY